MVGFLSSQIRQGNINSASCSNLSPYFLYDLVVPQGEWLCGCSLCHLRAQEAPSPGPGHTHCHCHCFVPGKVRSKHLLQREILGITPLCLWPKAHWSSPLKWGKMSTGKKGFASQKLFPDTWQWDQGEDWIAGNAGRQGEEASCSSRQNVPLRASHGSSALLHQDMGFFQWKMYQHPWWCYWNMWVLVNVLKSKRSLFDRSVVCCQPLPCAAGTGNPD